MSGYEFNKDTICRTRRMEEKEGIKGGKSFKNNRDMRKRWLMGREGRGKVGLKGRWKSYCQEVSCCVIVLMYFSSL